MDAPPPTPPLLVGWLSKRRDFLPVQAWRPRWCVLDVRAGALTYYEKRPADGDASAKPRGVIALPPGTTVAITDAGRAGKPGTPGPPGSRTDGGRVLCEAPGGGFWPFEVCVPGDGASGSGSPSVAAGGGRSAAGGSFSGGASPALSSGSGATVYRLAATLSADERGTWVTALRLAADPSAAAAVGSRPGSMGKSGSSGHRQHPVPVLRPSLQQQTPLQSSPLVPVVLQAAPSPAPTAASTASTTATGSSGGSVGIGGAAGKLYSDAPGTGAASSEAALPLLPGREMSQASVFTASSPHSGSVSIASGAATERELSTTSFGSFAGFAPASGGGGSGSTPVGAAPVHRSASSNTLEPVAEADERLTSRPQSFSSSSSSSAAAAVAPAAAAAAASSPRVPPAQALPSPAPKPVAPAPPPAPLFVPPPPPPAPYALAVLEAKIAELKRLSFGDDGWRSTGTTSGIACYAPTDGSSGCKGVGYIPFPRKAISFVLSDNEFKRRTDAQFHSGRQLQSTPEGQTTVSYWRFYGKVGVSGRDFVNLSHWRFEPDGTLIHVAWSVPHPDAPPVEGVVRANALIGGWIMTPRLPPSATAGAPRDPTVQSEPGCDTVYCMRSDLAGNIPAFITRQVLAQQAALVATTRDTMAVDFGPKGAYGPAKLAELRAMRATNINPEWEAEAARQRQQAQEQHYQREVAAVADVPAPSSPALSHKPTLQPTSAAAPAAVSSPLAAARVRTPKLAPPSLSLSGASSAAPSAAASVVSSPALAPLPPPAAAAAPAAAALDGDSDSVAGRPKQHRRRKAAPPEGDAATAAAAAAAPASAAGSTNSSGGSTPALKPKSPPGAAVLGDAPPSQPASGASSPQPSPSLAMAGGLQQQLAVMLLAVLAYVLLQLFVFGGGSGGGTATADTPAS